MFDRQFASLRASMRDETADLVAYYVYATASAELKKEKLATQSILLNVTEDQRESGPSTRPKDVKDAAGENCDSATIAATLKSKGIAQCVDDVRDKCLRTRVLATADGVALSKHCAAPSLASPERRFACNLAFAAQSSMQGHREIAETQLVQAVAAIVAATADDALQRAPGTPSSGAKPPAVDAISVALQEYLATPPRAAKAEELVQTIPSLLGGTMDAATTKDFVSAVTRLKTQWSMLTAPSVRVDFATFLDTVAGVGGAIDAFCASRPALKVCGSLLQMRADFGLAGRMHAMFRAVQRKDYREVAILAVRDLFERTAPEQRNGKKPGESEGAAKARAERFDMYRHFAESVTAYVLDVVSEGEPTEGSRAAFKDAAFDVIRDVSSGKGTGFDRGWSEKLLLPDFAMRYTYSSTLINQASGDGFRFAPTVDAVILRKRVRYTPSVYVAVQASLLDLAGPFSEMALRRNENYDSNLRAWSQFVRPRAEVLLGLPPLSTKLALTVGVSARITTAVRDFYGEPRYYTYRWIWEGGNANYDADPFRFAEMSIALKYVP